MTERRKILKSIPVAAVGLTVIGAAAISSREKTAPSAEPQVPTVIDTRARDAFPDVTVVAHTGERFRFYEDLIEDKIVMVNFMSIRGEALFPVTANLAQVAQRLGDKLGRDVFINSITRDPGYDTPERLRAFADKHGAPRGWRFLTGTQTVSNALATRLYRCLSNSEDICRPPSGKKFIDIVFYGNGGVGVWGAFPGLIDPDDAASRVAWVMPGEVPTGPMRRAGPRRISANERYSHNRDT